MKRALSALAAAALAVALAGCGSSAGSTAASLHFWTLKDPTNTVQQAGIDAYNKTAKTKVVMDVVPSDGYLDKLRTAMGSNRMPGMFFSWGGGPMREYATNGKIVDVAKLPGGNDLASHFLPAVLKIGQTSDGTLVGVPCRGTQPVFLFYNKKVFTDAGVQPPKTWSDVQALIGAFKGKGITPFAVAGQGGNEWTELMWLEYLTTGDRAFVERTAWPLAVQVLRFYTSALVADADGGRHAAPCFSPENTPAGATTPLSADATSEIAMIRDAVRIGCRFADLLGQHTLAEEWTAFGHSLPPYRVAADGSLAEWLDPGFREQPNHRHASHLYPLWYEPDQAFGPAERAAAAVTIAQKLAWRRAQPGPQEMAFGIVQLGLAAAHLGDAETALECVQWLARDHWAANLVPTHDEGAIFNVDAAGGLPHLVAEMLLQSTPDELRVLPALPAAWPAGRITGLRARGGVAIDELAWTGRSAAMTCRLVPGSRAARTSTTVDVVPPPHLAGSHPARTVELSADAITLAFPPQ